MTSDYERIAGAIQFTVRNHRKPPRLEDIAGEVGLSPFYFQRLFKRWADVTPKQFILFLTVAYAKGLLDQSRSVLDATFESGLSNPGRLHNHFISLEAVTPGEYKSSGAGLRIDYGIHESPFGWMLLAVTERGICGLSFQSSASNPVELNRLKRLWNKATFFLDQKGTSALANRLFTKQGGLEKPVKLLAKGTNFQLNIWRALLRIPFGTVCSYQQIAKMIGKPQSTRAVGQAVGANPIGYLVPCHRVIRSTGMPGGYGWGETRKRAIIAWEAANSNH
jgi:AraC family transcriptional regulator of adaptative response/methylated-DNA-[protein]-cysteine methyltransferase